MRTTVKRLISDTGRSAADLASSIEHFDMAEGRPEMDLEFLCECVGLAKRTMELAKAALEYEKGAQNNGR